LLVHPQKLHSTIPINSGEGRTAISLHSLHPRASEMHRQRVLLCGVTHGRCSGWSRPCEISAIAARKERERGRNDVIGKQHLERQFLYGSQLHTSGVVFPCHIRPFGTPSVCSVYCAFRHFTQNLSEGLGSSRGSPEK